MFFYKFFTSLYNSVTNIQTCDFSILQEYHEKAKKMAAQGVEPEDIGQLETYKK